MFVPLAAPQALSRYELELLRLTVDLGAAHTGGPLSADESELLDLASHMDAPAAREVRQTRAALMAGEDPLGALLCQIRPASERRAIGAFYTPRDLVRPMVDWILAYRPDRIVDAGCGSGRFAAEVARRGVAAQVVAIDLDPVATILTRAALEAVGARNVRVLHADYTACELERIPGRTAYVGYPPYVPPRPLTGAEDP